jgi:hypothetical protein
MKTTSIILIMFCLTGVQAQKVAEWKGGTPGRETAWEESKNWDKNRSSGLKLSSLHLKYIQVLL